MPVWVIEFQKVLRLFLAYPMTALVVAVFREIAVFR